jgi:hypothetical protein
LLDSGSLPGGLTLGGAGLISGTPTTANTFNFTVRAVNIAGNATRALSIVINPVPVTPEITITTHPVPNTTVTQGSISGSLSVVASVTPSATLSYQWYSNTTNSNTGGTAISGATSANFAIPTNLTAGTYYYFCEVRATGAASVRSNVATMRVVEDSGGCNALGFGYLAFMLFSVLPFVLRKKQ